MHPKLRYLYNLSETPFWAKALIMELSTKDPVEVVNVLEVILEDFKCVLNEEIVQGSDIHRLLAG